VAGKKERQRKLARERLERRLARQAQRERRTRRWTIGFTAGVVVIAIAVGGFFFANRSKSPAPSTKASASASATPSPTPSTVAEPATHCAYTANPPAARKVSVPSATPDYKATYQATITTNRGPIVIDLLNSKATCTVNSFVHLAQAGYFNNTQCHRLTTTGIYVLQCGDPYASSSTKLTCSSSSHVGTGTPGYEFDSENLTGAKYTAGTIAMANDGPTSTGGPPTTNGSQFFIVYKDSTGLGPDYTPFATVSSGLNIVQNVAKAGSSCQVMDNGEPTGGPPKDKVIINSVSIQST